MSKPIYAWIKYAVACAVMMCVSWHADAQRFIYYCGDYNYWPMPVESNESYFEDFKLYETSSGSNIYEGVITPGATSAHSGSNIHYFSFYSKLTSDEDYNNGLTPYWSNRLVPIDGYKMDLNGDIKPGYKFEFNNPPYYYENGNDYSWFMILPKADTPIKFTVDFNAKTLAAVFDMAILQVNESNKPSLDNISKYSYNRNQVYVPAGECKFRAYNFYTDKFYSTSEPGEVKAQYAYLFSESDEICTVPNWGGGTLVFDGDNYRRVTINNRYQSLNDVNPYENWGETAYLIGDYTGWDFLDENMMTYDNGIFYGVIPATAGNCIFKISEMMYWAGLNAGVNKSTVVGNTTFVEAGQDAQNIELNVTEDMNVSFEPARQAIKIWPASQTAPDAEPADFFSNGNETPVIPKFTGIVLDQKDMFVDLTKVAPSEVGISNLTAFETEAADSYQLIINGGLTKPFRFLQFRDDELVAVYQPVGNTTLNWVGDLAHGRVNTTLNDAPTYWTSAEDGKTTVTISPNSNDIYGITFRMPSLVEPNMIYMVGSMNSWDVNDAYANYQLKETTDGKYYGAFNIPEGQVELKFLKDLNGWAGIEPIAATNFDCPSFFDSTLSIPTTSTQYNMPNISFYWEGGMIYMLVNDSEWGNGELLLSKYPLDVTIADETSKPTDGIYLIDCNTGEKKSGAQIGEGIFQTALYSDYNKPNAPHRIKFVRAKHTFADTEPEYLDSYTLTFAETKLTPGDDGIAETSFTYNDGVNVGGGNEIEIYPSGYSNNSCDYIVVVDFNKNKIYFDNRISSHLIVDNDSNEMPTYETRNEFADNLIYATSTGMILNLPEGDVTLKYVNLYSLTLGYNYGNNDTDIAEATFDSDGVAKIDYWSTIYYPEVIKLHNCPGGEFFITRHRGSDYMSNFMAGCNFYFIALDKIKTFDAVIDEWNSETMEYEYNSIGQLTLTDPATETYSGRINVPKYDGYYYSWFSFIINNDIDFGFGGTANRLIIDDATKTGTYDIDPKDLRQSISFGNAIAPTVDITLSLETMKAEVKLVDGETANAFTINTGAGEISLPPTADDNGFSTASTVNSDEEGNISLNVTGTNGSIIVPANGDTEMIFDADGVFTDDIEIVKSPSAALRRAPLVAGKWYYSAGDGYTSDNLGISFDLVNKTATFISQNYATNLYAVAAADNEYITDVARVKSGMLASNADGTFTGKVHVAAGEKLYIVRRAYGAYVSYGIGYGLSPQATNSRTIDADNSVVEIPVIPYDMYISYGWNVENNPGCDMQVTYNPDQMMLYIEMDTAGVEDVAIDGIYDDCEPVYYNLQGVRIANPESGHIYIEIRGNKARKILK